MGLPVSDLLAENLGGDAHQVAAQFSLVPFANTTHLVGGHAQQPSP